MYVVDDFLPFFDSLVQREKLFRFYPKDEWSIRFYRGGKWRGTKTDNLTQSAPDLTDHIENTLKINLFGLFMHAHPPLPGVEGRLHNDGHFKTAGVIYLRGGPGCGTEVDGELVEFREIRLVTYDARILHRPQGFPCERLVVTFFSFDELPKGLTF